MVSRAGVWRADGAVCTSVYPRDHAGRSAGFERQRVVRLTDNDDTPVYVRIVHGVRSSACPQIIMTIITIIIGVWKTNPEPIVFECDFDYRVLIVSVVNIDFRFVI